MYSRMLNESLPSTLRSLSSETKLYASLVSSAARTSSAVTSRYAAISMMVGDRCRFCVSASTAWFTRNDSSWSRRGTLIAQPLSRK